MKNSIYIIIALVTLIATSCSVDDFQDANPPLALNGPFGDVKEVTGDGYAAFDADIEATFNYVKAEGTATFEIQVLSAPGGIGTIETSLSNIVQPENLGSVSVSSDNAEGATSGTISVAYTAGTILAAENLTVTIFDQQDPPRSVTYNLDPFLTVDATCFPTSRTIDGRIYKSVTTNVVDADGGPDIDRIIHVASFQVNSDVGADHPGLMEVSDGSFGLYTVQGYGPLEESVATICDGNITGNDSMPVFTGTVNAETGVINITWESVWGDAGTTELTPCDECSLDWSPSVYYQ